MKVNKTATTTIQQELPFKHRGILPLHFPAAKHVSLRGPMML